MTALPELTPQERAAAAARGVAARQVRAGVRAGLSTGELSVRDVLRDAQGLDERGRALARMRVVDLLSSVRGIGPVRAGVLMERVGIAANRRLGGLGPRQRDGMVEVLEARRRQPGTA